MLHDPNTHLCHTTQNLSRSCATLLDCCMMSYQPSSRSECHSQNTQAQCLHSIHLPYQEQQHYKNTYYANNIYIELTCRILWCWLDRKHIAAVCARWTIWSWRPVSQCAHRRRVSQTRPKLVVSARFRCSLIVRREITRRFRSGVEFCDVRLCHIVIVNWNPLERHFPPCCSNTTPHKYF